jgi:hypothetical protein
MRSGAHARRAVRTMLLAVALAGASSAWAQDEAISLHILNPVDAEVTERTTLLRLSAEGATPATRVHVVVMLDGQPLAPGGASPPPTEAGSYSLPAGGGQLRIDLLGVAVGVHTIAVRATSPPGVTPDSVVFSVAEEPQRGQFSPTTVVVLVVLVGAIVLYRQKVLKPRLARYEVPDPPQRPARGERGGRADDDPSPPRRQDDESL